MKWIKLKILLFNDGPSRSQGTKASYWWMRHGRWWRREILCLFSVVDFRRNRYCTAKILQQFFQNCDWFENVPYEIFRATLTVKGTNHSNALVNKSKIFLSVAYLINYKYTLLIQWRMLHLLRDHNFFLHRKYYNTGSFQISVRLTTKRWSEAFHTHFCSRNITRTVFTIKSSVKVLLHVCENRDLFSSDNLCFCVYAIHRTTILTSQGTAENLDLRSCIQFY